MRILVAVSESPVPPRSGLPLRVVHLARALAAQWEVEVAAISGVPPPHDGEAFPVVHMRGDFDMPRSLVRSLWQPWPLAHIRSDAMRRHVAESRWDVLQSHTLAMARYGATGRPHVFDSPDVLSSVYDTLARTDSRRWMRPRWRWEAAKTRAAELRAVRQAAAVTACTDVDAAMLEERGARRVVVVPNGVDVNGIAHRPPAAGDRIVYVGYFAWRPNVEAALELANEILPRIRARRPDASLELVGAGAPSRLGRPARAGVEIAGAVEDVMPHLRRARLTVIPLRSGGGSRLKVLEAMAAGIPVVATPFAVTGLGLRNGEDALMAERPAELAELALRVIEDDALAARLSAAGRRTVEDRFSWTSVARPLVELYEDMQRSMRSRG